MQENKNKKCSKSSWNRSDQEIELLPARFKNLDFAPREFPVTYSEKLKTIAQEFKAG